MKLKYYIILANYNFSRKKGLKYIFRRRVSSLQVIKTENSMHF